KIRHGRRASIAAADLRTGVQRYPTKDVRPRAGKGMGHSSTKAETGSKDARRVDAQIAQDLLENGVGERHVTTTGSFPAEAAGRGAGEALWCHEDGAVLREIPESEIRIFRRAAHAAVGDLIRVSARPVIGEYQTIRPGGIVVVRHPQNVL